MKLVYLVFWSSPFLLASAPTTEGARALAEGIIRDRGWVAHPCQVCGHEAVKVWSIIEPWPDAYVVIADDVLEPRTLPPPEPLSTP